MLIPITGNPHRLGPNGQFIGGNGGGSSRAHQVQVCPQLDRYNVNLLGHFDVSRRSFRSSRRNVHALTQLALGAASPAFIASGRRRRTALIRSSSSVRSTASGSSINNPFLHNRPATLFANSALLRFQRRAAPMPRPSPSPINLAGLGPRQEKRSATRSESSAVRAATSAALELRSLVELWPVERGNQSSRQPRRPAYAAGNGCGTRSGHAAISSAVRKSIRTAAFGYWPWVYGASSGWPRLAIPMRRQTRERRRGVRARSTRWPANHASSEGLFADRHCRAWQDVAVRCAGLHLGRYARGFFELPGGPVGYRARRRISCRRLLNISRKTSSSSDTHSTTQSRNVRLPRAR